MGRQKATYQCAYGAQMMGSKWHDHVEGVVRSAGKPCNYLQEMWLIVNLGVQGVEQGSGV
jgi:hypothetical protein